MEGGEKRAGVITRKRSEPWNDPVRRDMPKE